MATKEGAWTTRTQGLRRGGRSRRAGDPGLRLGSAQQLPEPTACETTCKKKPACVQAIAQSTNATPDATLFGLRWGPSRGMPCTVSRYVAHRLDWTHVPDWFVGIWCSNRLGEKVNVSDVMINPGMQLFNVLFHGLEDRLAV